MERATIQPIIGATISQRKAWLRPGETALVLALLALSLIAWAHPAQVSLQTRFSLLTVTSLFLVACLSLARETAGWRWWVREFLPVPVVPFIFLHLGRCIPLVNSQVRDHWLIAADRALLGAETQAALYSLPLPWWLTDLLTLAYSTFFFLPIALLWVLAKKRDPYLPQVSSAVILTFLISYLGYFVVPAYGPRATVAAERYSTLPEGVVGEPLRNLLDHWEKTKTDAFPSGHTMVTFAVLFCAHRRHRPLFDALLPIGSLLIAATLLLTYHYLVDVLAALPLTFFSLWLASRWAGPIPPAWKNPSPPEGEQ